MDVAIEKDCICDEICRESNYVTGLCGRGLIDFGLIIVNSVSPKRNYKIELITVVLCIRRK